MVRSTIDLTPDELGSLAQQTGIRLQQVLQTLEQSAGEVQLGETFDVWMLPRDQLLAGNRTVREIAMRTGDLHHQVFVDGGARAYARSVNGNVVSVFFSALAEAVEEAIVRADATHGDDDGTVRLLSIPAFYTHAFWFVELDRFEIIKRPHDMPELDLFQEIEDGPFRAMFRRVRRPSQMRRREP
jgi:hypothetical protein